MATEFATIEPEIGEPAIESIGAYLSRERRLRGISLDELAAQTRIPLRSLERLEGGHYDGDLDGFVRGFVRTVAGALGLDPDATVARMLREPSDDEGGSRGRLSATRVLVALGLVVACVAVVGIVRVVQQGLAAEEDETRPEWVLRRDPVRTLAERYANAEEIAPVAAEPPAAGSAVPASAAEPPR